MPGQVTGRPDPEPTSTEDSMIVDEKTEVINETPDEEPKSLSEDLMDLDEYNNLRQKEINKQVISEQKQSMFKCPRCSQRLFFDNPDVILPARPAKKKLVCKACNYVGYMLA